MINPPATLQNSKLQYIVTNTVLSIENIFSHQQKDVLIDPVAKLSAVDNIMHMPLHLGGQGCHLIIV